MRSKTGIIIQARMSSTRLPGKVLMPLAGKEILWHVVERCRKSERAAQVIVATTSDPSDEIIVEFCNRHHYSYYRGPLEDVLARYYECAQAFKLDRIVRVTSDCPLIDPELIDESIDLLTKHQSEGIAYVSNVLDRIFPRGLDCETFTFRLLDEAYQKATTAEEREHVTVYMRKYGRVMPHHLAPEYHGDSRLTVDEPVDFKLMTKIYERFYQPGQIIDVREVIGYLKVHPEIASINAHIEQKKVSA